MPRVTSIGVQQVEFIPTPLARGVLYVSGRFKTAAHLCACGCGTKVVTPLKPGGWSLTTGRNGAVSLHPSIGNFNLPCQSHYWIRVGEIVWADSWTPEQIATGRADDHAARQAHFDRRQESWWLRTIRRIKSLFN